MARNNQGLTTRQSKFLNTLALGHMTVEQVERHLGLACYTLRRWMDQKPFLEAWAKTNTLLQLRRGADDAILGKGAAAAEGNADAATSPAVAVGPSTSDAHALDPVNADRPVPRRERDRDRKRPAPKSDRELIRLRHGEEAARAFDDLLRRHAPPQASEPPSPAPPPLPAPPPSLPPTDLPPPTCGPSL